MGTMKRSLLRAGALALMCTAAAAFLPGRSAAQPSTPLVGSDIPAAIVTFPYVEVEGENGLQFGPPTDTFIQLANIDQLDVHAMQCFYVNALGRCSTTGFPCLVNFDCPAVVSGETCISNWQEGDFFIDFTPQQPLGWQASTGLQFLPCDGDQSGTFSCGTTGAANGNGGVPSVQAPFVGFLTCVGIEAIDNSTPSPANVFIGTASVEVSADTVNVVTYNGIGIQSTGVQTVDNHLCLGGGSENCPDAEYAACPQTLILNHLFDSSIPEEFIGTFLVLTPCTELEAPRPTHQAPDVVPTTVQFLIFNEFEQKTSTSTRLSCFSALQLSDIDTRPRVVEDNTNSVFNIAVQGTIGGQTRIRGVSTVEQDVGHGILGIAIQTIATEEGFGSSAVNLNFTGVRAQPDVICLSGGPSGGACVPNEE